MIEKKCYCGSSKTFEECCELFILGDQKAPTALSLMQSRYSAYATLHAEYLVATTHFSKRKYHSKSEILNWASSNQWLKLEIINATAKTVEFKAYFLDTNLQKQIHHEFSAFIFENGSWFYVDGKFFN
ncbi:YchJ family protein [Flavobacterium xinjiangense]|uniref:SEC-C motif-containing protein n=1 Tax=Flavobacterium xinjiangense TaxID=178356 RepID=A0A1M7N7Z9_9FLAO|nr:YchJ family metal-binding protein [Flavobacterium xinjiangense]SHM99194.1 SEC-C motif-containing protein [Flavobacterium xinjiangense]